MAKGDLLYLIGTGFALGVVHVLTGPDHLSALATLSANVGNNVEAAYLGIRWGIGHSSGLLVVGSILILLSDTRQETVDMPDYASRVFESIVGIFMLLLGTYGVRRAWLKRPKAYYNSIDNVPSDGANTPPSKSRDYPQHRSARTDGVFRDSSVVVSDHESSEKIEGKEIFSSDKGHSTIEIIFDGDDSPVCIPSSSPMGQDGQQDGVILENLSFGSDCEEAVVVEQEYLQTVSPSRCRRWVNGITSRISTKTMAFIIGIVHGLAGPGGVLGVIPAVQLRDWRLATIYLSCFCVSSTITMGCFATIYGSCSSTIVGTTSGNGREFQIECFSATLSILVGIMWLALLSMGKLEAVFP